ncbi:MAG: SPASM domain-containing protein, partial [Anaerolineales bacterium]
NGTLVTKEKAKRLVEGGLRGVNISIDSPNRKMHEKIRGVEGAFKSTFKAVQLFNRYKHKGKLTIRINTVVSRTNYQTLASLPDLAHELGADGINLIPVDDHCGEILSMRKKDIALFNEEIAPKLAERALALGLIVSDEDAFPFGRDESQVKLGRAGRYAFGYYDKHPCYAPWTHSLIDFNGNVYVCCMTREKIPPIGNIINQFTTIENMLTQQNLDLTENNSQVNGVDVAKAIIELQNQDYLLQLSQKLAATILPKSLLDYL